MSSWNKWIFGGLGWAVGGPIGGILGFALGSITEESSLKIQTGSPNTPPGFLANDFSAALLVLCAGRIECDQSDQSPYWSIASRFQQHQSDVHC